MAQQKNTLHEAYIDIFVKVLDFHSLSLNT